MLSSLSLSQSLSLSVMWCVGKSPGRGRAEFTSPAKNVIELLVESLAVLPSERRCQGTFLTGEYESAR